MNVAWNSSNENPSTVPLICIYLQVDSLYELVDVDLDEDVDDIL